MLKKFFIHTMCFIALCASLPLYAAKPNTSANPLIVYKSPQCGCCGKWVDHMLDQGFMTKIQNPKDLPSIKSHYGIPVEGQACHTAVIKQGSKEYVFEGHVPGELVKAFLANPPPHARGLLVPGMPLGSPGMEVGNRRQSYKVFQLNYDGSIDIFANVQGNE